MAAMISEILGLSGYMLALARKLDQALADDVAQQAMAKAINGRERFIHISDDGRDLKAWLRTIVINELRRMKYNEARWSYAPDGYDQPSAAVASQPFAVELKQTFAAIAELPDGKRALIMAAVDASYQDLATQFGVPKNTIKSRLARIRAGLAGAPG